MEKLLIDLAENSYEILKGLYGMNKIIIDGFENIQDGCEVYVINE